jgi:hypothetical protein
MAEHSRRPASRAVGWVAVRKLSRLPPSYLVFCKPGCATLVDFRGNRTMVTVDGPVIPKREVSHRSPSVQEDPRAHL